MQLGFITTVFYFSLKEYVDSMLHVALPSSQVSATDNGWMNTDVCFTVMEHFIKHSHSSIENATLLIKDGHETYINIKTINLAKTNGIVLFTISPHCIHKLQPLDKAVYGLVQKVF